MGCSESGSGSDWGELVGEMMEGDRVVRIFEVRCGEGGGQIGSATMWLDQGTR